MHQRSFLTYKRCAKVALILLISLGLTGCERASQEVPPRLAQAETEMRLEVYFFSCGKADSILLRQGEHALLVDAATDQRGEEVLARLASLNVKQLDALLITHEDKDHIGGADHILKALPVQQVYTGRFSGDSKQVEEFHDVMAEQKRQPTLLSLGDHFTLGQAHVTVVGPHGTSYEQENDLSLVLRVTFGQTAFLLTGDAEKPSLLEMMDAQDAQDILRAQVLKVPHHGRAESVSAAFFDMVQPQIAIICCQRDTKDALPEATVIAGLERVGAQVYVTGDGEVSVVSDGHSLQTTVVSP